MSSREPLLQACPLSELQLSLILVVSTQNFLQVYLILFSPKKVHFETRVKKGGVEETKKNRSSFKHIHFE